MKFLSRRVVILVLIIVLAFVVRLYKVTNPALDWHAFRQSDTAAVTYQYVKNGVDLLHPRYLDISSIQSGLDNPEGYRMVEFPIINAGIAIVVRTLPVLNLVIFSRLMSVFASLITIVCLYLLSLKISGQKSAFWTAVWFSLLPYSVFYSRAVLPEPFLLASLTASLLLFYFFVEKKKWQYLILSCLTLSLSLLLKPFALFLAPVFLALFIVQTGYKSKLATLGLILMAFSLVPLLLWRQWITQFPSGIPASDWLFNSNNIRLHPAWWRWLFYERLSKIILGGAGLVPLLFSIYKMKRTEIIVYVTWSLSTFAYLVVIATGNVQHDYYQVLTLPIICLLLGRGSQLLIDLLQKKFRSHFISYGVFGLIFCLSLFLSWQKVRGYFSINHWEYQKAGQAVDKLTASSALVIAPAMGDTQFLNQTNRRGWPLGFDIDEKIKLGANYYVTTTMDDEAHALENKYFTLQKTPDYLILDLTKLSTKPGGK